jgi:hypothetical protein
VDAGARTSVRGRARLTREPRILRRSQGAAQGEVPTTRHLDDHFLDRNPINPTFIYMLLEHELTPSVEITDTIYPASRWALLTFPSPVI